MKNLRFFDDLKSPLCLNENGKKLRVRRKLFLNHWPSPEILKTETERRAWVRPTCSIFEQYLRATERNSAQPQVKLSVDPDAGGPKKYGSCGSGSVSGIPTLVYISEQLKTLFVFKTVLCSGLWVGIFVSLMFAMICAWGFTMLSNIHVSFLHSWAPGIEADADGSTGILSSQVRYRSIPVPD
jgi:hypothetical protein